ncbi:MAG: PhzF family phenazine biosynthesis protein [Betaproteobacteria bacterium]|nr:PhzF family phenazine biosynthesis protein [Betaproteobacteria bacterium]
MPRLPNISGKSPLFHGRQLGDVSEPNIHYFVSRFLAPGAGVPEDPVTGSSHCTLTPYWAARLGKNNLTAKQVSLRGGVLLCELRGDRVVIAGQVAEYLRVEIETEGPAI